MLITPQSTLSDAFKILTEQLRLGAENYDHPFHQMILGTYHSDEVSMRYVILRDFDKKNMTLTFFTDYRSDKVPAIENNSNASLIFYHDQQKLQVRIKSMVNLHHQDEVSKQYWPSVKGSARKSYNSVKKPGMPIDNPSRAFKWRGEMDDQYFCVVRCSVYQMEMLQLNKSDHLRILFKKGTNGEWDKTWIIP